uniref:BHLH domain-containing protein n=1 Tax=Rhizophora mucronata TaxID=61149 RepID=A0A2P2KFR0_RHIMU
MDSLEDNNYWEFLDYNFIDETTSSSNFLWPNGNFKKDSSGGGAEIDFSSSAGLVLEEKECTRKRACPSSCNKLGTKACREKLRRERLNDRFLDLSTVLEPGRPAKADKPAILDDAIRVLNQLRTEAQELKETNEKLREEIKSLKVVIKAL